MIYDIAYMIKITSMKPIRAQDRIKLTSNRPLYMVTTANLALKSQFNFVLGFYNIGYSAKSIGYSAIYTLFIYYMLLWNILDSFAGEHNLMEKFEEN